MPTLRFRYPIIMLTAVWLLLTQAASPAAVRPQAPPPAGEYHVERVIDGDTIVIEGGTKVRYIGIDTPEAGEPFYNAAKVRNTTLLSSGRVTIEPCAEEPFDRYGRLLAWVYSGGVFVPGALLEEGLARLLVIPPCGTPRAGELKAMEDSARSAERGIWSEGGKARGDIIWGARSSIHTIETREAIANIGRFVRVRGRVSGTYKGSSGLYIHFYTGGPKGFSAVIPARSFNTFPPALLDPATYEGRTVSVVGVISEFVTRTEIVVSTPADIDVEHSPSVPSSP